MAPGGKIDLRSILQLARRRKWFLIIPPIVAVLGAYYRVMTTEPTYLSHTTIVIGENPDISQDLSKVLAGTDAGKRLKMRDMAENIQKQLLSTQTLGEVVDRIGLKPTSGMRERVATILAQYPNADEGSLLREMQIEWLAKRLVDHITFPKRGTYVEISFEHKSPDVAYRVVQALADVFIEQSLRNESLSVKGTRVFSEEKMEYYRQKYQNAVDRLRNFQIALARDESKNLVVNATNKEKANARINSLKLDIARYQNHVDELDTRLGDRARRFAISENAKAAEVRRQMLDKASRLAALTVEFNWMDAEVIKVNQDIASLRDQYRALIAVAAVDRMSNALDREGIDGLIQRKLALLDLELLKHEKSQLEAYLDEYHRSLVRRPSQDLRLAELQNEVSEYANILSGFEKQARGVRLREELYRTDAEVRYRIIDPANRPITPIAEDPIKILLIALIGGLGFGVGAVYLLEFFDHSFKSVDEVESFLGLTVLGIIPQIHMLGGGKRRRPLAMSVLALSIVAALVIAFVLTRNS